MSMEIAVFLGESGKTIAFNQSGVTKVYEKEKDEWKVIKEIVFESNDLMSTNTIRGNIKSMAESLDKCRVFVAKEIKGIPYTILDGMGCNIWKVDGAPEGFLDLILKNEQQEKLNKLKPEVIPVPIKNGKEGNYFIDIKTEMQNNPSLTSKQILLPFINNTTFNELEILCGHVPPWFKGEFGKLNCRLETEQINVGTVKVKVYRE